MLSVDRSRMWNDIEELARFSSGGGSGVTRLSFSPEDGAARKYLQRAMESAGLRVRQSPPGILIGRLAPTDVVDLPVMAGSHIDSVRDGGKFDGILGVVAAVETARVLAENCVALRAPFEVVVFPEEDGARFGSVLTGSKAWVGQLDAEKLRSLRDAAGTSYVAAMEQEGLQAADLSDHKFKRGSAKAFLELHIEQSVVLEERGIDIGVVTAISGIRGYEVTLTGVSNHAGATPMASRRDALAGAAEIMLQLEQRASQMGKHTVCTVGRICCRPGVSNAIPGEVGFSIDFRDVADIEDRARDMLSRVHETARQRGLGIVVAATASSDAVTMSPSLQVLIENVASKRNLSSLRMPSGAVHDAQVMAPFVETGMIFVPSRAGRSHCPEEFTEPAHIENGANVLLDAVLDLVG